jgi:hypothetical protein
MTLRKVLHFERAQRIWTSSHRLVDSVRYHRVTQLHQPSGV